MGCAKSRIQEEVRLDDRHDAAAENLPQLGTDAATRPPELQYRALAGKEIRLLTFEPDQQTDTPLRLRMRHVDLRELEQERHGYHALSYACGTGPKDIHIVVNDANFMISSELEKALRHLRLYSNTNSIWVDAICISQSDLDERADQVLMMKEIYESAARAVVWLGEERPGQTEIAVSFLRERIRVDDEGNLVDELEANTKLAGSVNDPACDAAWKELYYHIFQAPWWKRIWVVQEVAVAKRVDVLIGTHAFSWTFLERAVLVTVHYRVGQTLQGRYPSAEVVRYLPNARAKGDYRGRLAKRRRIPALDLPWWQIPILELLLNNISCEATDPRDMIYSLLGLSTDISSVSAAPSASSLLCSYEQSTEEVYTNFARVHIETHDSLDILTFNKNVPPKAHPTLPSWVPDWSNLKDSSTHELVPFKEMPPIYRRYNYSASADIPPEYDFSSDNILRVGGIRVDTIAQLGAGVRQLIDAEVVESIWASWGDMVAAWDDGEYLGPYVTGGIVRWEAFERTVIMDHNLEGQRAGPHERLNAVTFARHDPGAAEAEREALEKVWRTCLLRWRNRRFFITAQGYFGLGPLDAEGGDVIFVLFGCSVPMVLRPHPDGGRGEWTLVGEAFVLGLMDGEVIDRFVEDGEGEGDAAAGRALRSETIWLR
ncbi:heterokaryon incompatibility protein-domain-containing protein [Coniochaeta sp. 2T2.1]|nr:heterokaryon incompatibility protein-domain-containing protein [Coniochaeta sp. 2T2.1]